MNSAAMKPNVTIKSYFADSIESAMDRARKELGPDALLIDTREAPPEAAHLGRVEVVFGWEHPVPGGAERQDRSAAVPRAGVEELQRQLSELREMIGRIAPAAVPEDARAVEFRGMLVDAGVEPRLAGELVSAARKRAAAADVIPFRSDLHYPPQGAEDLRADLYGEMLERFAVAPFELCGQRAKYAALVGPPGAGKTTTLVKLAVRCGFAAPRSTHLLSADCVRVGAAAQLQTYAALLGVGCTLAETPRLLHQTLQEQSGRSLVLVDTPGCGSRAMEDVAGMAEVLAAWPDMETLLVLPATMKCVDMLAAVERFALFRPSRLVFTKADETDSLAAAFSTAALSKLPVAFICAGQAIPEDLVPANPGQVIGTLAASVGAPMESAA